MFCSRQGINYTKYNGDYIMPYVGQTITDVFPTSISVDTATIATANISNQLTDANMSAGTVIQVVQGVYSTTVSSTSNTYIDTGLTATITPSSTSSKILVTFDQQGVGKVTNNTGCSLRLMRDTTQIQLPSEYSPYTGTTAEVRGTSVSSRFLDSPNTTSATTYKVQFKSLNNNATALVNDPQGNSNITLMEIAQ